MKNNEILNQLKYFIVPHPIFADSEEDIFTPRKGISINIWAEGGFEILAKNETTEINFNSISTGVIVFSFREMTNQLITRLFANKIIGFELIRDKDNTEDISKLLDLKRNKRIKE